MILTALDFLGDAPVGVIADHVTSRGAGWQEGEQEENESAFHDGHLTRIFRNISEL
jgi:hypothetical protein